MPNTYLTDKAALDPIKGTPLFAPKWCENRDVTVIGTYTWPASTVVTLGVGDIIKGPTVPAGAKIVDVTIDTGDLEGNATSLLTLNVGDGTTAARYLSASTVGRAGGIDRMSVAGSLGYSYTTDTPILVTVLAAAGTAMLTSSAVTFKIAVTYTADA
jgi:hypothetical protein